MREYRIENSLVPITEGKEGLRGFGFEPAFNEFYDLYASDKVSSNPILRLEDIAPLAVGCSPAQPATRRGLRDVLLTLWWTRRLRGRG